MITTKEKQNEIGIVGKRFVVICLPNKLAKTMTKQVPRYTSIDLT